MGPCSKVRLRLLGLLLGLSSLGAGVPVTPAASESSGAGRAELIRSPRTELRVLRGRATWASPTGLEELTQDGRAWDLGLWNHLEFGAGSSARVSQRHLFSVDVRERSSFGVHLGDVPGLKMLSFGSLDVELRRGSMRIELPQGWALELGRCALYVSEKADGRIELVHRGGQPVRIRSLLRKGASARGAATRLRSGGRLLLPRAR